MENFIVAAFVFTMVAAWLLLIAAFYIICRTRSGAGFLLGMLAVLYAPWLVLLLLTGAIGFLIGAGTQTRKEIRFDAEGNILLNDDG
jgi:hypothetical protein